MDNKEERVSPKSEKGMVEKEAAVGEYLNLVAEKIRERKKIPTNQLVEELCFGFPDALKEKVMRVYDRHALRLKELKELGASAEIIETAEKNIGEEMEIAAREVRYGYIDQKLGMPNGEFSQLEALQAISEVFESDPSLEDLRRVAYVSFDLDGLKPVNDLTGKYANGDQYLLLMKKALENPDLRKWAEEKGLSFVACHESGDEFGVVIRSKESLTEEILNGFITRVQEKLEKDERAAKILDFSDEKILLRYEGVTEEEWAAMGEKERIDKIAEIKKEIPEGYKFTAHVSAGAATLYDGLMDEENQAEQRISLKDNYSDMLEKTRGFMFGTANRGMHAEKDGYKNGLSESQNPNERMQGRVLVRNREERLQKKKTERDAAQMAAFKSRDVLKNDLIALYDAGASPEAIAAKKKEIAEAEEEVKNSASSS